MKTTCTLFLWVISGCFLFGGELEQVLDSYYKARGGLEKLRSLHSMKAEGTITLESSVIPFTLYVKGKKSRLDIQLGGLPVVQVFDGHDAWQLNPTYGTLAPQPLSPGEEVSLIELTDISGPLVDWKEKGYSLLYLGKQDHEEKPSYRIQVQTRKGMTRIFYLDHQTFLPFFYFEETPEGLTANQVNGYIKADGISFTSQVSVGQPSGCTHSIHNQKTVCGFSKKLQVQKLTLNLELEDQLFQKQAILAHLDEAP